MYKLYSILLKPSVASFNGNRGRMIVQAAHGFLHSIWDAEERFPESVKAYRNQTAFKMALICEDKNELEAIYQKYREVCGISLVIESGSKMDRLEEGKEALLTCLGLGPIHLDLIGEDIKALKPFI